jgi:hypothetical protein
MFTYMHLTLYTTIIEEDIEEEDKTYQLNTSATYDHNAKFLSTTVQLPTQTKKNAKPTSCMSTILIYQFKIYGL